MIIYDCCYWPFDFEKILFHKNYHHTMSLYKNEEVKKTQIIITYAIVLKNDSL